MQGDPACLLIPALLGDCFVPKKGEIFAWRLCIQSGIDKTAGTHVERSWGRNRLSQPRLPPQGWLPREAR